eukprot:TRINITY_DN35978_c0_g1_i1.p1 TRINITY_DN35978_c0_g1~~TRINITY_DN35978_c0_g1_i1.p1  ORF type:complete len:307 (+),score=44.85 TRINITY_DN35978_c0_g1_i1:39-923(+)
MSAINLHDPQEAGAKPPFEAPSQEPPGVEAGLNPRADHGQDVYKGSGKLKDRVALITGGDSGIGRAVALAYAREGADVVISYLNEDEDAQETQRLVEAAGRNALVISGDIQTEDHCKSLVRQVVDRFGKIDILVNNAAFQMMRDSILDISTEEYDRTLKTNLYALFWLSKAAIPHIPRGGSIINSSSIQGAQPSAGLLIYASTKAAITNFTMGLAADVADRGIRVNAVAPGPVWTPLIPSTMKHEKVPEFGKNTLLKRPAQPRELAPIYVLLASDEGSYITGMIYGCTGGQPLL